MSPDDLSARLRATFLQELEDQLREIDAQLLELEKRPDDADTIRSLFRSAHAVKGAARVAGVPLVEDACHALETLFAQVRDAEYTLTGRDFALLFATVDALEDAHRRLHAHASLDDTPLGEMVPRIRATTARGAEADTNRKRAAGRSAPVPGPVAGRAPAAGAAESAREPEPAVGAAEPAPEPEPAAVASEPATAGAGATDAVRVPAARLDALAAHATDLLTASGAIGERPEQLDDVRSRLTQWAATWRRQARGVHDEAQRTAQAELDRRLHQVVELLAQVTRSSQDEARALARMTDDILTGVRGLRLRRFGDAVQGLPRAARDVATATGKQVELVIEGEDMEADRVVIDALREPLLHLVRNAIDHGIEEPSVRHARGKPEQGTVRVAATLEHGRLQIIVEDDGGGLDVAAIRNRLAARGEELPPDGRALARRLLAGGVSTREQATSISGRGVGLDLVRAALERIGGTVDVRWKAGAFVRIVLEAPPSPATLRAIVADAGGQLFALPVGQVERVVQVTRNRVRQVEGRPALLLGDAPVPLATLAGILGPPLRAPADIVGAQALVLRSGGDAIGLVVDRVADEREVVVRPLHARAHVPHVSGGALLPSGRVALVLVARTLVEAGLGRESPVPELPAEAAAVAQQHVLVVDDSITTRTLEQSVLEAAGFRVTVAVDGQDAWEKLHQGAIDLVLSDIEMPRMTGFDLCRRMRASKRFAELPVVLVTGLESPEDRALGLEVGADAYVMKSSFDQSTLLDTIHQLIG